jgi:hypothetical protein
LLARAFALAAVGFVVAAGAAAAHEGYVPTDPHGRHASTPVASVTLHSDDYAASELPADVVVQGDHNNQNSAPCSEDRAGGHASGTCCTVACHAALAAPPIGLGGSPELASSRIVAFVGMLEGRSSDRAERPPKLA